MIHGQLCRREFTPTVMANAACSLALPPLRGTELPGLRALTPDVVHTRSGEKRCFGKRAPVLRLEHAWLAAVFAALGFSGSLALVLFHGATTIEI